MGRHLHLSRRQGVPGRRPQQGLQVWRRIPVLRRRHTRGVREALQERAQGQGRRVRGRALARAVCGGRHALRQGRLARRCGSLHPVLGVAVGLQHCGFHALLLCPRRPVWRLGRHRCGRQHWERHEGELQDKRPQGDLDVERRLPGAVPDAGRYDGGGHAQLLRAHGQAIHVAQVRLWLWRIPLGVGRSALHRRCHSELPRRPISHRLHHRRLRVVRL
mmetsp:Transcript_109410/g.315125  ORF Transcript_109410/g.315125 Transcript_109410/m.315125 type:complete len:218 (+) Transcript_109410:414-1067(+)